MTDRPPRDIDARRFFEEWLPERYAAERGGTRASIELRVRVLLDGDGGGAWDLSLDKGKLTVAAAAGGEAPVTLRQTVADWRAVAVGEEGAIDLAPPETSPLDMLLLDARAREMLATIRGTVRFEVSGYQGRTWSLTVKLGDQPPSADASADATITVDAETYAKLRARQMLPPEAYFSGKVQLAGNTGLAMQVAMALMSRFA